MNKSFIIALALILALIQGSNGKAITDQTQRNIILNKHNEMRRMAAKGELSGQGYSTAAKMYPLTWDNELANSAEQLASSCNFNHNRYGQNLAMGGGGYYRAGPGIPDKQPSGTNDGGVRCSNCYANENEAIEFLQYGWIGEEPSGPNANDHFTQMLDDDTLKIGCALNNNCAGNYKYYLVCNYDPAGNNGNAVYKTGSTASQCPNGNNDGLCSGTPQESGSGSSSGTPPTGGSSGGSTPIPTIQEVCGNSGGYKNMYGWGGQCTYIITCNNGAYKQDSC